MQLLHFVGNTNFSVLTQHAFKIPVTYLQLQFEEEDDEHEPFILAQFFNINDHIPSASSFKISMSTKFLLQLGRYSDHTCTYTTHKVMWEGFPLFLNGTTDMCRSYHPKKNSNLHLTLFKLV